MLYVIIGLLICVFIGAIYFEFVDLRHLTNNERFAEKLFDKTIEKYSCDAYITKHERNMLKLIEKDFKDNKLSYSEMVINVKRVLGW